MNLPLGSRAAAMFCLFAGQMWPATPRLPAAFEAAAPDGQGTRFIARGADYSAQFTEKHVTITLASQQPEAVRVSFAGANQRPEIEAADPEISKSNYYLGNHRKQWRHAVKRYGRLIYHGIYPGIDAVYYGNENRLEYDLVVQAGADPGLIELQFAGTTHARIDETGELVLQAKHGELRQRKPVFYQETGSARSRVTGRYVLDPGNQHVRFQVSGYDRSKALIIDPLLYSSYFGGNGADYNLGFTRDTSGNVYVTGSTTSTNLPATNGSTRQGTQDAYVAKFNPGGGLLWCTYLGGTGSDTPIGAAVDSAGNVYVEGRTVSADFPLASAFQSVRKGTNDAFVTKLDANGVLVYSTYLGGAGNEYGLAIGVDASGSAVVAGATSSSNFPVANAFQTAWRGNNDGFVTKLNAAGNALIYSSYMGGGGQDYVNKVTVLANGEVLVAGDTTSTNLPVYQALQPQNAGLIDGFLARIGPGGALSFWTYLGGSGNDAARDVKLTAAGEIWVVSETTSTDVPLINPYWPLNSGGNDLLLQRITATGTAFTYSGYFGGSGDDLPIGLVLDATENVYIAGTTTSANLTKKGPLQPSLSGTQDGLIVKLDPTGTQLLFSSHFGGTNVDTIIDVQLEEEGKIWISGDTLSTNLPTLLPAQSNSGGLRDAFLARIDTCGYEVSSANRVFQANGGNGTVDITTSPECAWTVSSSAPWITFPSTNSGAGNGSVSFSVAGNTATAASSGSITAGGQSVVIDEAGTAASLTAIAPASGGVGTAVAVTLTGSDFAAGMAVTSSNPGITVSNVSVSSATVLTATLNIAANATLGPASITAMVTNGASNPIPFTVSPQSPTLTAVAPASGQNGSNLAITLTGTQFVAPATVASNNPNILSSSVVLVSSTQINLTLAVAAGVAPGPYELRVTTPGGTSAPVTFTVNPPAIASLLVSPTSVTGGSSAGANKVTLSGPAPPGGAVVLLSSSDPAAATPASITVPQGATSSSTFVITTTSVASVTTATISATYGSSTKTGTLTINAVKLNTLTLASGSIAGGKTVNATVTLTGAAPTGGAAVTMTSSDPAATVPATATVAQGATSVVIPVTTGYVTASTAVSISASYGGVTKNVNLSVLPTVIATFTSASATVISGKSVNTTVTLNGPAPTGGAAVTMTSSDPAATVPATVTVAQGATTAVVPVTASYVGASSPVTISAAYGGVTKIVNLSVLPTVVSNLTAAAATVISGKTVNITVTLNGPAATGGAVVTMSSSAAGATVPATATVAQGATTVVVPVTASYVTASTPVTISASLGGVTKNVNLSVLPTVVSNYTAAAATVISGKVVNTTITLNGPAPPGGAVVNLSSSVAALSVPAAATVPQGATTVVVPATASYVAASTPVTISASYGGVTRNVNVSVLPTVVSNYTAASGTVKSTKTLNTTVTLNGPAPPGGAVVSMSSSNAAVTVAATATVAQGATTVVVPVTAGTVTASTSVTLSAVYGGATRNVNLTVIP